VKFIRTTLLIACAALAACSRVPTYSYECSPAQALTVQYINSPGAESRALLTLNGAAYTLTEARSASGARYVTAAGRSPGATLVWWNKGNEGTLLEGKVSDPDAAEQLLATCTQAP
jgi:membrane-bound inhibitor of C-type lysozyme